MYTPDFKHVFFDFDSTFVKLETMEVLVEVALQNSPDKEATVEFVRIKTREVMDGNPAPYIPLRNMFRKLAISQMHVKEAASILRENITDSFARNINFFTELDSIKKRHKYEIYIISGSFRDVILPVVQDFEINPEHVYCNNLIYSEDGIVTGIDADNPLLHLDGKATKVTQLDLPGEIYLIGDGANDLCVKEKVPHSHFFAFTENVKRPHVLAGADREIQSLDELLDLWELRL